MIARPWLLQIGPLVVPTAAREEMAELTFRASEADYLRRVWALRYPAGDPARCFQDARPSTGWPYGAENVTEIKQKRSARG